MYLTARPLTARPLTARPLTAYALGYDGSVLELPNLVANGGFDSGASWTISAGWVISGGVASRSVIAAFHNINQNIGVVDGASYRIRLDFVRTSGTMTIRLGNTTGGSQVASLSASASIDIVVAAIGTGGTLMFVADTLFAGSIDNVIVSAA